MNDGPGLGPFAGVHGVGPWLLAGPLLLALAAGLVAASRRGGRAWRLGVALIALLPVTMLAADLPLTWTAYAAAAPAVRLLVLGARGLVLAGTVVAITWALRGEKPPPRGRVILEKAVYVACAVAGIAVVTAELAQWPPPWSGVGITVWWIIAGLAVFVSGGLLGRTYLKCAGIVLLGAAAAKAAFADAAHLALWARLIMVAGIALTVPILTRACHRRAAPRARRNPEHRPT